MQKKSKIFLHPWQNSTQLTESGTIYKTRFLKKKKLSKLRDLPSRAQKFHFLLAPTGGYCEHSRVGGKFWLKILNFHDNENFVLARAVRASKMA